MKISKQGQSYLERMTEVGTTQQDKNWAKSILNGEDIRIPHKDNSPDNEPFTFYEYQHRNDQLLNTNRHDKTSL